MYFLRSSQFLCMELSRIILNTFGGVNLVHKTFEPSIFVNMPFPFHSTHDFIHLLQEESSSMRMAPMPRSWMLRSMPFDFLPTSSTGTGLCCPTQPWPMTFRGFTFMIALRPPRRVSTQCWLLSSRVGTEAALFAVQGPDTGSQLLVGLRIRVYVSWFGNLPHFQFSLGCVIPQAVHQEFHWQVPWGNERPWEEVDNEAWDGAEEVEM